MSIRMVIALLCVAALGCGARGPSAFPGGGLRLDRSIEFEGSDGVDLMHLKLRPSGVALLDSSRNVIARFRIQDGHLLGTATKTAPAVVVAPPRPGERGLRILDAVGGRVLYSLRSEPDGDLGLEDARARTLYEIKVRDYGLKVERNGKTQAKVRVKHGKISVRDRDGKTVFTTRDPIPASLAACLTMNELPLTFRVGLGLAILHWGEDRL